MEATIDRKRIVILGGGFAGAYCAQALEKTLRGLDAEIWLIDRNNYFVFHPLLVEAGTGSLHPRHAVVSIRSFLRRTVFRMGEVLAVRPEAREVVYRHVGTVESRSVPYDHLVLALGSVTRMPPIPGLLEYGFGLKSLVDAVELRDRAIQMLEQADATDDPDERRGLLRFVVVGANFTGVEVAGEFLVFLRHASREYRNVRAEECSVTLIEITDRILSALSPELSDYALQKLREHGVEVRLSASVAAIRPDRVELDTGESLPTHTVIWCAGIASPPLLSALGLPTDRLGYLVCEPDLRVRGRDDIWGIGDGAVNIDPQGNPYPATAQHAVREGVFLAKNLRQALRGEPTEPFRYRTMGWLAALGCRTGVAELGGIRLSGFAAWFLWRTIYLFKMPGWSRRLRVALDWTADLVFRRDFVELGVHRRDRPREDRDATDGAPAAESSGRAPALGKPRRP